MPGSILLRKWVEKNVFLAYHDQHCKLTTQAMCEENLATIYLLCWEIPLNGRGAAVILCRYMYRYRCFICVYDEYQSEKTIFEYFSRFAVLQSVFLVSGSGLITYMYMYFSLPSESDTCFLL